MRERYRRLRPLGHSPRGEVWLVDGPHGRAVLKTARGGADLREEIAVLRAVSHPGLVRLLDHDLGARWMVTELLPGGRADLVLRDRPLAERVRAAVRLAEALAAIHDAGLTHGDVKPSNVLLDVDGNPRLIDPGGPARGSTAPERLIGGPPTVEADLWGLGAWLYGVLAGRPPFGSDAASALAAISTVPEPPSSLRPGLPGLLDALVLALLARRPEARPGPASVVADALRSAEASAPHRRPVVGMDRTRDALRRAVVDLIDGTGGVFLLHGRLGSGRRTLRDELARAARRERLPVVTGAEAVGPHRPGDPVVVVLDGLDTAAEPLVRAVLGGDHGALVVARVDRPRPDLAARGARNLAPEPLDAATAVRLLRSRGMRARDAAHLHTLSGGHPAALWGLAEPVDRDRLAPVPRRLVEALDAGPGTVDELAIRLGWPPVAVVEAAEALLDEGWVVTGRDGWTLRVPQPRASR